LEKAGSSSPPNLIVTFSGLEETKPFFAGEEFNMPTWAEQRAGINHRAMRNVRILFFFIMCFPSKEIQTRYNFI
jgi:hypothetical protein